MYSTYNYIALVKSRMYSTYNYIALTGKYNVYICDIFHLQFNKCYLLSEYKPLLKQCRIICHLRLWKLSKSAIFIFWAIAGFWRKSYVVHTTILHKLGNVKVATKGAYDYIALTQRNMVLLLPYNYDMVQTSKEVSIPIL